MVSHLDWLRCTNPVANVVTPQETGPQKGQTVRQKLVEGIECVRLSRKANASDNGDVEEVIKNKSINYDQ